LLSKSANIRLRGCKPETNDPTVRAELHGGRLNRLSGLGSPRSARVEADGRQRLIATHESAGWPADAIPGIRRQEGVDAM
jgi:hypothetical protein